MSSETAAQQRLRGLVEANLAIVSDLDLRSVLRRIVEAARDLVGAEYAALGVLSPHGTGLDEFIAVGMTDEQVAAIGRLPEGKGLLGALIDQPRPIRVDHLQEDPRSVGFPEGHPAMDSFLGVPVRIRDDVFGNLYLTNARSGRFDEDDEALVSSLAAAAGIAVHNARLFAESRQRQDWLQAAAWLTTEVLTVGGNAPARSLVDAVARLADADAVLLVVPEEDGLAVLTAAGDDEVAADAAVPDRDVVLSVLASGTPTRVAETCPAMMLPLTGREGGRGVLVVRRAAGRHPFGVADLDMAAAFTAQASLALEVAQSRVDQQRMAMLQDRTRIARDLHDHVIQQLFAAGMMVQGAAGGADEAAARTLDKVVDTLDEAVRQIRTSIFQLRPHRYIGAGLRSPVLDVSSELVPALGFEPSIDFDGPVDAVSDEALVDDVVAVVREALSNTAKHARAATASVLVAASDTELRVVVDDDGVGLDVSATRRSGLANLQDRAARRGGTLSVAAGASGQGTTVTCVLPLS